MIGETALADGDLASETAIVADEATALVFPTTAVRRELEILAPFRVAMAAALVNQRRETERRLEILLMHSVEARLISFLLDAALRWGRVHASGQLISALFTHADLAQVIGSTRETVTLVLNRLRAEGWIAFDRRRLVIVNRACLEEHVRNPGGAGSLSSAHPRQRSLRPPEPQKDQTTLPDD
jgi:CRP-like cAMP-binding protein